MAKRITLIQVPISPQHIIDSLNRELSPDDPARVQASRTVSIPDGAMVYVVGWEHQSAGNPAAGTGMLNLVVLEDVND